MKRTELVIFDCDGVLVDSEPLAMRVDVEMLATLGWSITAEEAMLRFFGRTDDYLAGEIERNIGRSPPAQWWQQRQIMLHDLFSRELQTMPGVVDVLNWLDNHGVAYCVASNGSHQKMETSLGVTGILERFDQKRFSSQDVASGKPAPDLFLYAAQQMGFVREACFVVEDSPSGVHAAIAAEMNVCMYAANPMVQTALDGFEETRITQLSELMTII